MNLVVDASIIVAWLLEDENSAAAESVAIHVVEDGAWVPQLFPIEIANVLLQAVRRRRITPDHADEQLRNLADMLFTVDSETSAHSWTATYTLAVEEGLTVYDATYLELAERRDAVLATLDTQLAAAARRRGLTVVP